MNIFANIANAANHKRKREIILLFGENFCDFQLVQETIQKFRYDIEDIVFVLQTKLLNSKQEKCLDTFLRNELGEKYKSCNYKPTERYVEKGQPCVRSYHQNLECYIFTSDTTEKDIADLNNAAKKIVSWTSIIRRPTQQEIQKRIKQERKNAIKEKNSNIGFLLFVVAFFSSIILGCIYIDDHKEVFSIIGSIVGICFILFLFFVVWSFVSENANSKLKSTLKTVGITLLIIAGLLLIGYLLPDSCSHYVNDAHRPDRF